VTAQAPGKTRSAAGGRAAEVLLALALLDGIGTSSGILTGEPRGDTSYAVYAGCGAIVMWWLASHRPSFMGPLTALGRLVSGASLAALFAQATIAAVKPAARWPAPEAVTTVMAIPVAVACGFALLVLRERAS
jgi:hypothetical protein